MRLPFIAGVKHTDRVRGSGWLDCPNCHEHALQDVLDELHFFAVFFYRFAPIRRTRSLLCRCCNARRPATLADLKALNTSGTRIRRTWFVPFGALGMALLGTVLVLVQGMTVGVIDTGLTFVPSSGAPIAPVGFLRPATWSVASVPDADPPYISYRNGPGGAQYFKISRIGATVDAATLLREHFRDEWSITTTCFPDRLPQTQHARLAGQDARAITVDYVAGGGISARLLMWSLVHDHVGYTMTYVGTGTEGIATLPALADRVNGSIEFTSVTEATPEPSAGGKATPIAAPPDTPAPGDGRPSPPAVPILPSSRCSPDPLRRR